MVSSSNSDASDALRQAQITLRVAELRLLAALTAVEFGRAEVEFGQVNMRAAEQRLLTALERVAREDERGRSLAGRLRLVQHRTLGKDPPPPVYRARAAALPRRR